MDSVCNCLDVLASHQCAWCIVGPVCLGLCCIFVVFLIVSFFVDRFQGEMNMFDEICDSFSSMLEELFTPFAEVIVCTCPYPDDRPCYEDPELDCDCCVYCMHDDDLPDDCIPRE